MVSFVVDHATPEVQRSWMSYWTADELKMLRFCVPKVLLGARDLENQEQSTRSTYQLRCHGWLEVHNLESLGLELCRWNQVPGPGVGGPFVLFLFD